MHSPATYTNRIRDSKELNMNEILDKAVIIKDKCNILVDKSRKTIGFNEIFYSFTRVFSGVLNKNDITYRVALNYAN